MSAIFGIYNRTMKAVTGEEAGRLGNNCLHRGPDGMFLWCHENIALGNQLLCTTHESLQEQRQAIFQWNKLVITGDVRVDNRMDLAEQIGLHSTEVLTRSDCALILLAYEKWGRECFSRILGDFAVAIWDGDHRQLICARDIVGVKPLYYHLSQKKFLFCSEIKPLLLTNLFPVRPNEDIVAEYLTGRFLDQQGTLYTQVNRLEPGSTLVVHEDDIEIQRFWLPSFETFRRYRKEHEYVEEFKEIFGKAVRCRMRSHLPVSVELSGGLDSSSITTEAARQYIIGGVAIPNFYAIIFPAMGCDEENYIRLVQEYLKIECRFITFNKDFQTQSKRLICCDSYEFPDPPNLTVSAELLQSVNKDGSRVVLTGIGGDEWFSGSEYPYLDLLTQGKIAEMGKEFLLRYTLNGNRTLKGLVYNLVCPLLPSFFRAKILSRYTKNGSMPWIDAKYLKRSREKSRSMRQRSEGMPGNTAMQGMLDILQQGNESRILEANDKFKSRYQLEARHPFLDKRIIEFALALPENMRRRHGWTKYVMRKALIGQLPTEIIWRRDKAEFSDLFSVYFQNCLLNREKLISRSLNRWLNGRRLLLELESSLSSYKSARNTPFQRVWPLWFAVATSLWYKNSWEAEM